MHVYIWSPSISWPISRGQSKLVEGEERGPRRGNLCQYLVALLDPPHKLDANQPRNDILSKMRESRLQMEGRDQLQMLDYSSAASALPSLVANSTQPSASRTSQECWNPARGCGGRATRSPFLRLRPTVAQCRAQSLPSETVAATRCA